MRYLIAILCPPLAILLCGKLFTAIGNLLVGALLFAAISVFAYPVMVAHAWIVIASHKQRVANYRSFRLG